MQFTPWDNPMGTDEFEFIECAAPNPVETGTLFARMGFITIARHRHKQVTLYRQGKYDFILNADLDSFAQRFARLGPSIRRESVPSPFGSGTPRSPASGSPRWAPGCTPGCRPGRLNTSAIKGAGDSLMYFVDPWRGKGRRESGRRRQLRLS